MSFILAMLKEPVSQLSPQAHFDGFYEAYQFQTENRIQFYSRLVLSAIATVAVVLAVFTMVVMRKATKIRRTYQFIIAQHVVISSYSCVLFPVSGVSIIGNYGVIYMDKWSDSSLVPFIVFVNIAFGYIAVIVICFHSFVLNVVWSTNFRFPCLKTIPAETVVNVAFVAYELASPAALFVFFHLSYSSVVMDLDRINHEAIRSDPRLDAVFRENNVVPIVVTWGLLMMVCAFSAGLVIFPTASGILIAVNYHVIHKRKSMSSAGVQDQQKRLIILETLYFAMTLICYIPSCVVIILSMFLKCLPEVSRKLPITLFMALPLQLLPVFDCLLHIYAIRMHRVVASEILKRILFKATTTSSVTSSVSEATNRTTVFRKNASLF